MANILTNKIFLAGIFAILVCQFLKLIIYSIKDRRFNLKHIYELSGMPSTHTSTAVALTAIVYYQEGISALFVVWIFITIYVIDEVLWIDKTIGLHSQIFNKLSKTLQLQRLIPKTLRERWGHTYDEVIVGGVIGWLISWAVNNYL